VDEWVKKRQSVGTTEYYSAFKKEEIPKYLTTLRNLEDILLSELSQSQEDE
jgi:hypothetical protein